MSITVPQLKEKLESQNDLILIDVRSESEVQSGLIPGAKWISLSDREFMSKIKSLPKDQSYCIYCASGGRSDMAVEFMRDNGFTSVESLDGGISSWLAGGNKIEKT